MPSLLKAAPSASASPRSSFAWLTHPLAGAALIVTAVLLAWSNAWSSPFEFDDHASIIDNATIRHLWPADWLRPAHTGGETVAGRAGVHFTPRPHHSVGGAR